MPEIVSFSAGFISGTETIVFDTPILLWVAPAYPFPELAFDGLLKPIDFLVCELGLLDKENKRQRTQN